MGSLSCENEFYSQVHLNVNQNLFSYERFRTWTHFEREVEGNSEMAYKFKYHLIKMLINLTSLWYLHVDLGVKV